ncbi:protein LEAD-SENSITIVE 1 [Rosa sericea]
MGVLSNKIDRDQLKPGDHIYTWRNAYLYAHHGIYVREGMVIHFTRAAGLEIGTGTVLDRFIFSSSPSHSWENPCTTCGGPSGRDGGVLSSCLDCFLSGGDLYLFEYGVTQAFFIAKARGGTCTLASSDPSEDVLHRASYLLENGFGSYSLFKNNCEDFAIYCKTGLLVNSSIRLGRSGQASSAFSFASFASVASFAGSSARYLPTMSGLSAFGAFGAFSGLGAAVGAGIYCVQRLASDIGFRSDVSKVPVEELGTI